MTKDQKLKKKSFAAHDEAAKKALEQGKSPREAAISGLAAELMFMQRKGK